MLPIESAEYTLLEGVPALHLTINGKDAYICDVRPALLEAGYVYLISMTPGFQWEDELPVLTLPPIPGISSNAMPFPGITNDLGILKLTHTFVDALNGEKGQAFKIGPIPIS